MASENNKSTDSLTSEVGSTPPSGSTLPPESILGSGTVSVSGISEDKFNLLLETQNRNMIELIKAVEAPQTAFQNISLPKFNPEGSGADPLAWCSTVDMRMTENSLQGSALIIALSKALDGSASQWLLQVCFPGITWSQFKNLFIAHFDGIETAAATLINMNNSRPKEGECLSSYGSRLITSLMSRWRVMNIEEVAVSVVLAHTAQFDNRLQRIAFTTSIKNRAQLQNELKTFSYTKRKVSSSSEKSSMSDIKRHKLLSLTVLKCHYCDNFGHKMVDRRSRKEKGKTSGCNQPINKTSTVQKKPVTCFKCGAVGHISTKCPSSSDSSSSSSGIKGGNGNEK